MINRIKGIFQQEAEAIRNIPVTESFKNAIELIHRQVHEKSGKLIASGMGKAGEIAKIFPRHSVQTEHRWSFFTHENYAKRLHGG